MIRNLKLLRTYNPYHKQIYIKIANEFLPKVVGIGTVCLLKNINLNNVLDVPELSCNLFIFS